MDSTLNIYGFVNEENVLYQGKIVAVKLSKNCKVYKVTFPYWKRGSSQEDGDDISMTLCMNS